MSAPTPKDIFKTEPTPPPPPVLANNEQLLALKEKLEKGGENA